MDAPRLASRVLLVDAEARILLFRARLPDGGTLWVPPGGGLDPGESYEAGALRELYEETGVVLEAMGPCVWERRTEFFGLDQYERYFFARVEHAAVITDGNVDAAELALILEHRWWSLPEIEAATDQVFVPRALARLLAPLLAGDIPEEPIVVHA